MAAPKILCDTAGMDRRTWLAARAHGPDGSIPIAIGGSDVAAIFGISPWKTPLDLWLEKSGKLMPDESENMWQKEMGHLLEPVVAQMYAFRTGHRVITDTYLYQHALYPWALANIDYGMEDKDTKEVGGLNASQPPITTLMSGRMIRCPCTMNTSVGSTWVCGICPSGT